MTRNDAAYFEFVLMSVHSLIKKEAEKEESLPLKLFCEKLDMIITEALSVKDKPEPTGEIIDSGLRLKITDHKNYSVISAFTTNSDLAFEIHELGKNYDIQDVIAYLKGLFADEGTPKYISVNENEVFKDNAFNEFLKSAGMELRFHVERKTKHDKSKVFPFMSMVEVE